MTTLTTMTPREVDTHLAEAFGELSAAQRRVEMAFESVHYAIKDARHYGARGRKVWATTHAQAEQTLRERVASGEMQPWHARDAERALATLDEHRAAVEDAQSKISVFEDEFARRGGWSRFFLVQASNGHIHSSMNCSTCYPTTQFGWLPEVSGQTEAEAVANYGAILCTVCFPSAPVEWTNKYEVEAAAKAAEQCPGSGTFDYPRETARLGYYTGNYGVCEHCHQRVTVTSTNKMRKHKPGSNGA